MSMICNVRDFDHAIRALDAYLRDRDYTRRSRQGIAIHVRATGTLEGTVPEFLDSEDMAPAEEILVGAFEPVSFGSPEWGEDDGCWEPNLDSDAWIIDPEDGKVYPRPEPEAPDESAASGESYWAAMMADGVMPLPVCGGSPDDEPFEPTEEDRRDYAAWSDQLDVSRDWYDRNGNDPDRPMGAGFITA